MDIKGQVETEYWEESWRLEKTGCHLNSRLKLFAHVDVNNSQNNNNNNNNKNYMHHPAPVLDNDAHKLPWDFDIQTDHLISVRRPDIIIINNKKKSPIVIGAFGTVNKGSLKDLEDLEVGCRVETIQTTALLKTARILRRVLETWGDLLSLNLQWKTISLRWCENL